MISVLRQRQTYGLIDSSTIILTVDDPQEKLGSGGATLNALLIATEHLSAKAGFSVSSMTQNDCRFIFFLHLSACQYKCFTIGPHFDPSHCELSRIEF